MRENPSGRLSIAQRIGIAKGRKIMKIGKLWISLDISF
jgi:hypothetical protein